MGGPVPDYPQRRLDYPGSDADMTPPADHGEESYVGLGRLTGKIALITGGDSGIGRAAAIAFAREGADVAISYLPEEGRDADETRQWIEAAGRRAVTIPGDITDESHCSSMVAQVIGELGRLDVLVNNAAFQSTHESLEAFTTEEFEADVQDQRVRHLLVVARRAAIDGGGQHHHQYGVHTGIRSQPQPAPLCRQQGRYRQLLEGALSSGDEARDPCQRGRSRPRMDAVDPVDHARGERRTFGADTVLGRAAQPVEIAPLFNIPASNEARFVTGEVYGVTGGQTPY